jgi:hypothetical protein
MAAYGFEDRGSIPGMYRDFTLRHHFQIGSGVHLSSCQNPSSGVKLSEREIDPSHPSSVEVKNTWSYTSIFPYVFME